MNATSALVDIADAGHRALVQQRVPELFPVACPEPAQCFNRVECAAQQVRTELHENSRAPQVRVGQELDGRRVEGHRHRLSRLEHGTGLTLGPPPRLARPIPMPRPAHAQVGPKRQPVVEADDQVLAASLDQVDRCTDQAGEVGDRAHARASLRARGGDASITQRLTQDAGGTEDGVAFGHAVNCAP